MVILFDCGVVLGFAGQVRMLGGEVGEAVRQCDSLQRRVTDSCVGGFVGVFEEKMGVLKSSGWFLAGECERAGDGLYSSGYRAEDIVSHVFDYSGLGFLAVRVETGGVRRLGDVLDSAARVFTQGKVQADIEVLREVARGLRSIPSDVRVALDRCAYAYEDYEYQGGRLVPLHGAGELFTSIRAWIDDCEILAVWLEKKAQEFEQTQHATLATPTLASLTGVHSEYIDPLGHGSEHRDRPILEAFFRGLKQGTKDTVSTVGGLFGVVLSDSIQPDFLNNPEKELEDAFSALKDDPLGTLQAVWDSIAQSFQTPEGAAEFVGGIAGGAGVAGAAAKGIKIVGKGIKGIEKPRGRGEKERDTPPPPPGTLEANLKEVLKIDGAQFENGLFGVTDKAQIWKTNTPEQTAQEVAETLTKGYENKRMIGYNNESFKGWVYTMPDGSTVTYRPVSSGKRLNETYGQGSPAIDIGKVPEDSTIKNQKIHFKDIP